MSANDAERKVAMATLVFLAAATAFFTVLHHGYPQALRVPSLEGIPYSKVWQQMLLDLPALVCAWLAFRHAWLNLGLHRATLFLGGSFIFTGVEESMWILLGRYAQDIAAAAQGLSQATGTQDVRGTYYFTRGGLWFLETPILACVGWFFVAYGCVFVADKVIPKAPLIARAALGGFLAMNVDLWLDPVQTAPEWKSWIWMETDPISLFSIPLSNFMGWFLLIFIFAIVFEKSPALFKRFGPWRGTLLFYGLLMALEIGILIFFAIYGTVLLKALPEKINFTLGGI